MDMYVFLNSFNTVMLFVTLKSWNNYKTFLNIVEMLFCKSIFRNGAREDTST